MKISLFLCALLIGCGLKPVKTPGELAHYKGCDPEAVAYYVGNAITYTTQKRYLPAETCLATRQGDCKCAAIVARDTLNRCVGYEARLVVLAPKSGKGNNHAIAVFTDYKGQRGFIDWSKSKTFPAGTDWAEVIASVKGGPWRTNGRKD
jgi:hypothetical protein